MGYIVRRDALRMPPSIVLPHAFIDEIVKIKVFEMLELAPGRGEHLFADAYMVIHRTTYI